MDSVGLGTLYDYYYDIEFRSAVAALSWLVYDTMVYLSDEVSVTAAFARKV